MSVFVSSHDFLSADGVDLFRLVVRLDRILGLLDVADRGSFLMFRVAVPVKVVVSSFSGIFGGEIGPFCKGLADVCWKFLQDHLLLQVIQGDVLGQVFYPGQVLCGAKTIPRYASEEKGSLLFLGSAIFFLKVL